MAESEAAGGSYTTPKGPTTPQRRPGTEGGGVFSPILRAFRGLRKDSFQLVSDTSEAEPLNSSFDSAHSHSPRLPGWKTRAPTKEGERSCWQHARICSDSLAVAGRGSFEQQRFGVRVLANLRLTLSRGDLAAWELGECLVTALFCETLGHAADFAYIHAVNLTAHRDIPLRLKRLAYLLCGLCLPPGDQRLLLLVNNIQKDLTSEDHGVVGVALTACVRVVTEDTWHPLAEQVWKLVSSRDNTIRKQALLVLQHFHRLIGKDALSMLFVRAGDLVCHLLSDDSLNVAGCTLSCLNLATELVESLELASEPSTDALPAPIDGIFGRALSLADAMIFPQFQSGQHSEVARPTLFTQVAMLRLLAAIADKVGGCFPSEAALRLGEVLHGFLKRAWRQGLADEASISSPLRGDAEEPEFLPSSAAALVLQVLWVLGRPVVQDLARMPELSHVVQSASRCIAPIFNIGGANSCYVGLRCCGLLAMIDHDEARTRQEHIVDAIHGADAALVVAGADVLSQMARADNTRAVVGRLIQFVVRPPRGWRRIGGDGMPRLRRHLVRRCYETAWRATGSESPLTLLWVLRELPTRFPLLTPPRLPRALCLEQGDTHAPFQGGRFRMVAPPPPATAHEQLAQDVFSWLRDAVAWRSSEEEPEREEFRAACCDLFHAQLAEEGGEEASSNPYAVGVLARGTTMFGRLRPLPTRAAVWALGELAVNCGSVPLAQTVTAISEILGSESELRALLSQEGGGMAVAGALLALTKLVCIYTGLRLRAEPTLQQGRDNSLSPEALLDIRRAFTLCGGCSNTTVAAAAAEGAALLEVALESLNQVAMAKASGDFFGANMGTAEPFFSAIAQPCATVDREEKVDRSLGFLDAFVSERSEELRSEGRSVRPYAPPADPVSRQVSLRFDAYNSPTSPPPDGSVPVTPEPSGVHLNVPKQGLWGREGYGGRMAVASPSMGSDSEDGSAGTPRSAASGSGGHGSSIATSSNAPREKEKGAWLRKAIRAAGGEAVHAPILSTAAKANEEPQEEGSWNEATLHIPGASHRRWGPLSTVQLEPIPTITPDGVASASSAGKRNAPSNRRPRRSRRKQDEYQQLGEELPDAHSEALPAEAVVCGQLSQKLLQVPSPTLHAIQPEDAMKPPKQRKKTRVKKKGVDATSPSGSV
eukprot:Hpha_TRINITY_DN30454_c0_g1::TRINITY_DN30454_c0_g1_i1::g.168112::m.168112/K12400/AP4E1; AP-4 complex subunit epsilon-1